MPEKAKARIDPRVSAEIRVDLEYPWGSGGWTSARSLDLSSSGIYVGTEKDLPLKAQLGCRIYLSSEGDDPEIMLQARIPGVFLPPGGSAASVWVDERQAYVFPASGE